MKAKQYLSIFVVILIIIPLLFLGYIKTTKKDIVEDKYDYKKDDINEIIDNKEIAKKMEEVVLVEDMTRKKVVGSDIGDLMLNPNLESTAKLVDVSGGVVTGMARYGTKDGYFDFHAVFSNLLDPEVEGDFYEGWLVKRKPFEVISTGKLEKIGGLYTDIYRTKKDLIGYDLYVLTLEPDDGDPAPAKHIAEGVLR